MNDRHTHPHTYSRHTHSSNLLRSYPITYIRTAILSAIPPRRLKSTTLLIVILILLILIYTYTYIPDSSYVQHDTDIGSMDPSNHNDVSHTIDRLQSSIQQLQHDIHKLKQRQ